MAKKCLNLSDPDIKKLVKEFGETFVASIVDKYPKGKLPTAGEIKRAIEESADKANKEFEEAMAGNGNNAEPFSAEDQQAMRDAEKRNKEKEAKQEVGVIPNWQTLAEKRYPGKFNYEKIAKESDKAKNDMIYADTEEEREAAEHLYEKIKGIGEQLEKEYKEYLRKRNKAIDYILDPDFKHKTIEELEKDYWGFVDNYEPDEREIATHEIMTKIREEGMEEQANLLESKNPEYNREDFPQRDMHRGAGLFAHIRSATEGQLDLQFLGRALREHVIKRNAEKYKFHNEIIDAAIAVKKEYNKKHGIIEAVTHFSNPFRDMEKFYKGWFTYPERIEYTKNGVQKEFTHIIRITSQYKKDKVAETRFKALTPVQQEYVRIYDKFQLVEFKNELNRPDATGTVVGMAPKTIIKIHRSLADSFAQNKDKAMLQNYIEYLGEGAGPVDQIHMYHTLLNDKHTKDKNGNIISTVPAGTEQRMPLSEIKKDINQSLGKSKWNDIVLGKQLKSYDWKAKKLLDKKQHERKGTDPKVDWDNSITNNQYSLSSRGRMLSPFHRDKTYQQKFSGDHTRALLNFVDDMVYIRHMEPLVPYVEAIDAYNNLPEVIKEGDRKFFKEFFDTWMHTYLYKGKTVGFLGMEGDKIVRALRIMTHWKIMGFAVKASGFNVFIGKYSQFRGLSTKVYIRGEKRYFAQFRKTQNVIKHWQVSSIEQNREYQQTPKKLFTRLAFSLTRLGENYIQYAAIAGQISEEHWNWMDTKGELKITDNNGKLLTNSELERREKKLKYEISVYTDKVRDLQGAYSTDDLRNFGHYELGKAGGQFKIWMFESWVDRFSKQYYNMDAANKRGTLNFLISKASAEVMKDMKDPGFWSSQKNEHVLMRRNIKSLLAIATMMLAYGGVPEKVKDLLGKAIADMLFIFNPSTAQFMLKAPVPAIGTVTDLLEAIRIIMFNETYKTKGKGYSIGDSKAPGKIKKLAGHMGEVVDW